MSVELEIATQIFNSYFMERLERVQHGNYLHYLSEKVRKLLHCKLRLDHWVVLNVIIGNVITYIWFESDGELTCSMERGIWLMLSFTYCGTIWSDPNYFIKWFILSKMV